MKTKIAIYIIVAGSFCVIAQEGTAGRRSTSALSKFVQIKDSAVNTFVSDSLASDSMMTIADSIVRNIIVNDSLSNDTLPNDTLAKDTVKASKSMLDMPVDYTAKDSVTFDAAMGYANLYGDSKVNYQNLELQADLITMNLDSSMVHAVGRADSTGKVQNQPIFKQGSDQYEPEKISYNFKTRKAFINNVYTPQGNGFLIGAETKRDDKGLMYVRRGKYTTCNCKHPHFYLALTRAIVNPGKDVVFGPAYLVVEDVPLPLAIPYGFFPFSKSYSSGFIMPSFGDESVRGFYLRDGGYYFAINDKMDLKLIGEIYTKGSWGLSAQSTYRKRYRFNGNYFVSYQNTVEGEKNMPDYSKSTSFKILWTHSQDSKANPTQSFSASVNFATSNYERNNLVSMYNPESYTQSTRTSSVNYSKTFESIGLTLSGTFNLSQNMSDSTISMTLPSLDISLARFYPFKRKKMAGEEKWYEKIALSYTGSLSNSINTKEHLLLKSNIIRDWRNGMNHKIPVSATFTLFDYINVTPSFNFTDRMYSHKIMKSWDEKAQKEVNDTIWGFNNVYNYDLSLSASTKLYGFYTPLIGKKIQTIRHVFTPTVSLSYAPDFGADRYGYYASYVKTDADGNVSTVSYSPYSNALFGVPSKGKTGNISMDISNNIEMKYRNANDSLTKVSLIDELGASMSYNMAAASRPWSDLNMRVRIKTPWNYTFSMNAVFATYAYEFDENGSVYVGERTEWSYGRFGRFQGMSQNLSYTFNNDTFKNLFGWGTPKEDKPTDEEEEDYETGGDTNVDPDLVKSKNSAEPSGGNAEVDEDGYLKFKMPWSFTVSYGVSMSENRNAKINPKRMRYPYKLTHTLNFSGNWRIADGWNINYSSGYDFNYKQLSMTTMSLSRDLHCFSMSASVVLTPYTSYNFTFSANAAELADVLKWKKQSSYSTNIEWY